MDTAQFQAMIWHKAKQLYRPMPWRSQPTLHYVLVSELMLQQTQVARVLPKFAEFTAQFPTIEALAAAQLPAVLQAWQGLGYNRRAKYLHSAAQAIAAGAPIATQADLMALPGIGVNTAGAIMNYVHQTPTAFVETNIRTVYFNHFFAGQERVADRDVLALVEQTMDKEQPRQWFWALMDYGAELKTAGKGQLGTSRHYTRQSRFAGSLRQMRGEIVRRMAQGQPLGAITQELHGDSRFAAALDGLRKDGLVPKV